MNIRTLLAGLLVEPDTVVGMDELIDLIWGQTPPPSAVNQIQIAVSRLRATFAKEGVEPHALLATKPPGYCLRVSALRGQVSLDLHRFREGVLGADRLAASGDWPGVRDRLDEALALWRGPAFQDVSSPRVSNFAERLEQERQHAWEKRAAAELLSGRYAQVASQLSGADPGSRERVWYLKILASALDGRQGEALSAYRLARETLAEELGLEPGAELRDLEKLVLTGIPAQALDVIRDWLDPAGGRATPEEHHPVPRQLPPGLPDLVGRATELEELDRLLATSPDFPTVVAISGISGIGKTTLAVRAARVAGPRFRDGCLFTDLRGGDADTADPHVVIGHLLRAQGIPGSAIPQEPEVRLGMYRSVLAERQVLLVLDCAVNEKQVRPLIPPAGSAVLLTSRQPLSGLDGVQRLDLPALTSAEAVAMLASIAGAERVEREPEEAARLAELCGHLPLALRIVGVRLGQRADLTVAAMVRRLADERYRLDELSVGDQDVRAGLALSVSRLSPESARMLGSLGLLPTSEFPGWAAASLGGEPLDAAERLLDRLVEAHLLTIASADPTAEPRFRLHDLVRLYAREQAASGDEPLRATYAALLRQVLLADAGLPARRYPSPSEVDGPPLDPWLVDRVKRDPVGWFEAEWEFVCAAARDALRREWLDLGWRLIAGMTNFVGMRARADEWLDLLSQIMPRLSRVEPAGQAALLLARGGMPLLAESAEQLRSVRQARRIYVGLGDPVRAASAGMQLGTWLRTLSRERPARAAYQWALAQLSGNDSGAQEGWARLGLGNLELQLAGKPAQATQEFARARAVMRRAGDRMGEANALGCLGNAARRAGDSSAAVEYLRSALAAHIEIGDPTGQGMVEAALAEVYRDLGMLTEATSWNERAYRTLGEIRSVLGRARSVGIRATLLHRQGRPAEAMPVYAEAIAAWRGQGLRLHVADGLIQLAAAAQESGQPEAALAAAAEAELVYAEMGSPQAAVARAFAERVREESAQMSED